MTDELKRPAAGADAGRKEGRKIMVKVVCPRCDGAKAGFAIVCSASRCRTGMRACDFCKGEGEVSSEAAERWREGRTMHDARVKHGLKQQQEAERLGISPIELNDIEHGRLVLEQVGNRAGARS
jgi:hypothetical protein